MPRRKYSKNADHNEVINRLYIEKRELQEQVRQLTLALGATKVSCTWEQLIKNIKIKNKPIAALMQLAYVRRYERGRIWLIFKDLTPEQQFLATWKLQPFLKIWTAERNARPFQIKIKIL